MGAEYGPAIDMFGSPWGFPGALSGLSPDQLSIVLHKTACNGFCSATDVANYFLSSTSQKSVHFVVGKDGSVIQVVHLVDGAAGNCCLEAGHDPYWDPFLATYGNLNRCTYSIEHEDWSADNSDTMPQAQIDTSFALVLWLCQQFHIPPSHIKGHNTLDPVSRARCPGPTYPMSQLIAYVEAHMITPTPPPTPNPNQRAAFLAEWTAVVPAMTNSGIADAAWTDYQAGRFRGPALTQEYHTVDWNGKPIVVQLTPAGRFEWNGTSANFYPYH